METRILNQAVKRNIDRFPDCFCFQLTEVEFENWRSQFVISNKDKQGLRHSPYAFTEQGVAMLSALLRSNIAVKISIEIMDAFVQMRRLMLANITLYQRLNHIELKQLATDKKLNKFEEIFTALEKDIKSKQGIFFEGQLFDAYNFAADIIKSAKKSLVLIDNYVDETTLMLLTKRKKNVAALIYTKKINKQLAIDLQKHNSQYPEIKVLTQSQSHDRFLIIDHLQVYHFGASLKDLGNKCFAFSRMDFVLSELQTKILNLAYS